MSYHFGGLGDDGSGAMGDCVAAAGVSLEAVKKIDFKNIDVGALTDRLGPAAGKILRCYAESVAGAGCAAAVTLVPGVGESGIAQAAALAGCSKAVGALLDAAGDVVDFLFGPSAEEIQAKKDAAAASRAGASYDQAVTILKRVDKANAKTATRAVAALQKQYKKLGLPPSKNIGGINSLLYTDKQVRQILEIYFSAIAPRSAAADMRCFPVAEAVAGRKQMLAAGFIETISDNAASNVCFVIPLFTPFGGVPSFVSMYKAANDPKSVKAGTGFVVTPVEALRATAFWPVALRAVTKMEMERLAKEAGKLKAPGVARAFLASKSGATLTLSKAGFQAGADAAKAKADAAKAKKAKADADAAKAKKAKADAAARDARAAADKVKALQAQADKLAKAEKDRADKARKAAANASRDAAPAPADTGSVWPWVVGGALVLGGGALWLRKRAGPAPRA